MAHAGESGRMRPELAAALALLLAAAWWTARVAVPPGPSRGEAARAAAGRGLMGAWGHGGFDNDGALDWLDNAATSPTTAIWRALLVARVVPTFVARLFEPDVSSPAVAAAEVVAAWAGRSARDLPPGAARLARELRGQPSRRLVAFARGTVASIAADSGLREMWCEAPEPCREWTQAMADLAGRLR